MASRKPFSRHRPRTGQRRSRLDDVFAFAARTYGWTPRTIEEELTDEQLVALFDADADEATARWADGVETVRSGYVLGRSIKAYESWRRDVDRKTGRSPQGGSLADLARSLGGGGGLQVVRGEFEFRN